MSLDNTLWFAGIAAEIAVVGLLLYRHVWRTLPIFCAYCSWVLFSDAGNWVVQRFFADSYTTAYLAETIVDSVLEFAVLVELAWAVLRPIRMYLPRGALVVVAVLIVGAGVAIWPFAGVHGLASYAPSMRILVRMQQTVSILRVMFCLALAGSSQLLSIGWRDRELQVATGLGFYSLVSLGVEFLHSQQGMGPQYRHLQQAVGIGYLCSLLYWVVAFASKEAERREFTPQMESLLLAVAGTARATRRALTDSPFGKGRKPSGRG